MNYLLDKKLKRKKIIQLAALTLVLVGLIYFGSIIARGLSRMSHFIFRPVLILGGNISEKFSNVTVFFQSKKNLEAENENLRYQLNGLSAKLSNYNAVLDENLKIREILGRKAEGDKMILAAILGKPNRSPYDTLVIDAGIREGIKNGDLVFALSSIPIGRVAEVYSSSAKVVLFSSWGEKTEVVISLGRSQMGEAGQDIFMEVIGRGGGNFEMILPRDLVLENGTEMLLPGIDSLVLGIAETIISDPRDAFQKVLLVSPVNVQELRFVEVKK
ncbi:MAG: rod shape-determining protein MreC [Patescibacteria group bacterium]